LDLKSNNTYFQLNKFLLILFFILCSKARAQDSIDINQTIKIEKSKFSEKDIYLDNDTISSKKFDNKFKQRYKDSDFEYEEKTKEKNAWDRFKEWLAGIVRNIFSFTSDEASMTFVSYLMKFLAIIVIGFVVYLIVKAILNKEGKWIFGKNSDKKIINYSDVEKNLQLVDFEKLIEATLLSGEKRLTIRYYYLWLLKKLSAKEIIVWDLEKTNSDYLYEIKNRDLKEDFVYLSYLYEYIWYGEFEISENTFEKATNSFDKVIKSLGNV
jgi:hypothetical protein